MVSQTNKVPSNPSVRIGVDLGHWALVTATDDKGGKLIVLNLASLRTTIAGRRRVGRSHSPRVRGSRGCKGAEAEPASPDVGCEYIRRESSRQMTSQLVGTYGEMKFEDLDILAVDRSIGRRAFRRSVSDARTCAFRPILTYEAGYDNVKVDVVRYLPSSQLHHGCAYGQVGAMLTERLNCDNCGAHVDKDENASMNIRERSNIGPSLVKTSALFVFKPPGTGDSSVPDSTHHLVRKRKSGFDAGHVRKCESEPWNSQSKVQDGNLLRGGFS